MAKRKKKSPVDATPLEALQQLNLNAAGLDIGAEEIYACVPADRDERPVRVFATFTADLYALADWLDSLRHRDGGHGIDRRLLDTHGFLIPLA